MEVRSSLAALRSRLLRKGLPRDYVDRLVAELDDHHDDAGAEGASAAESPLGDLDSLIQATVREYRRRRFAGRHPVLTFLIAPLPLVVMKWVLCALAIWGAFALVGVCLGTDFPDSHRSHWLTMSCVWIAHYVLMIAPPLMAVLLLARWAGQAAVDPRWVLVGTLLVALVAGAYQARFTEPIGAARGSYQVGLGLGLYLFSLSHVWQFVPPLAALGLVRLWTRRRELAVE